jgi:thiol-disulfide isomerase/thioredoxin
MQKINKALILVVALCSTVFAMSQKGNARNHKSFINKQYMSISGEINNYIPNDKNGFLTFKTFTVDGESKDTSISIHKDGKFSFKLLQSFEGDFTISYARKSLTLYYLPGTVLNIKIDAAKWDHAKLIASAISLSGEASQEGILLADFTNEYYEKTDFPIINWDDSNKSDVEVSLERISRLNVEKTFLNRYIKDNNIKNERFIKWSENFINYNAGFDIAFENFTSLRKKSLTIDQLMKLLQKININNTEALHNSNYYTFLHLVQGAIQIIININPLYKDSIKVNGMNPIPVYTHYFDLYSTGFAKQLMYFDLYPMVYKAGYDYIFDDAIIDAGLKEEYTLLKKSKNSLFTPFDVIDRIRISPIDTIIKNRLINIFESQLDSFLFVDFWGTWCAPCMTELPFYPQLIRAFEKNKIKFLLIAAYSEENKVQEIKEKLKIDAQFIVLKDNDIKALNNILKFHSYPSHFLISPKGFVLKNIDERIFIGENLNQSLVDKIKSILVK